MKKITAITLLPVVVMFFAFIAKPIQSPEQLLAYDYTVAPLENATGIAIDKKSKKAPAKTYTATASYAAGNSSKSEELVNYALTLIGSPYMYGGTTTEGFDCSGFTSHVYQAFDLTVGRSSGMQAADGVAIDRADVRTGDLLIFTGTDVSLREPGHVGIVISAPGDEAIEFVHSSSVGGVKISKVEGTGYDKRLLQIRRVL